MINDKINRAKEMIFNNKIFIVAIIISFFMLLYRISIHADIYDEIINLNVSYRISLGDLPFYNAWEAFQSGDLFLSVFLKFYVLLNGSTEGIVLYSRLVYLVLNIFLSFFSYYTLKQFTSKTNSALISLLIPFLQIYGLYYFWYDTVSIYFLYLGQLFILNYFKKNKSFFLFIAGLLHGFMSFSYPSFSLVAIIEFICVFFYLYRHFKFKIAISKSLLYVIGGMAIIISFLCYCFFVVGIDNFLDILSKILSKRGVNSGNEGFILFDIIKCFGEVNQSIIIPSICLLIYWGYLCIKRKSSLLLVIAIIIFPFFNQFTILPEYKGLANYVAYIALWGGFLFFLLKKDQKHQWYIMFLFVWIPTMLTSVCISLTTVYSEIGPIKSWQAFYPAFIFSLCIIVNLIKNIKVTKFVFLFILFTLLYNFFSYIYLNQPFINEEDVRCESGIFKGIKVNEYMSAFPDIEKYILENVKSSETILVGSALRPIYLMTNLKPFVPSVESPMYIENDQIIWDIAFDYFDYFNDYPDLIIVQAWEIQNKDVQNLLNNDYLLRSSKVIGDFDIYIYSKQ